jgi:suppressor for copper-sensitivity B
MRLSSLILAIASATLVGILLLGAAGALAAAGPWAENEQLRLRLISAADGVSAGGGAEEEVSLGLQFEMQPGWKIYWRSPGDAGFPPSLDWSASENLAAAEVHWPVPERFSLFGLETFGYGDQVILPITGRLENPDRELRLRATVDYLVCSEICIPYQDEVSLELPPGTAPRSSQALLIDTFRAQVPGDGNRVGLSLVGAILVGTLEAPVLQVRARSTTPFTAPDLLIEGPPEYAFGKPEVVLSADRKDATLRLAAFSGPQAGVLEGKRLLLTLTDQKRGMEKPVIARFAEGALPPGALPGEDLGFLDFASVGTMKAPSLLAILGLALLGGLILNLMPCVLPVLSIKLLSVVGQGGRDRRDIRLSFLATSAGIVFSFLLLATAAITLKAAGMAVGWGIQFQQPLFLAAMAVLVTLFACNLFGFFEISLPGWLGSLAGSGGQKGVGGAFATGIFATLLATPCSAPFLGTAVGFALARGAGEILLIFSLLGLGLALPYLAVAALPGLAQRMPRPGQWMIYLRRILGVALLATAAWLLSVLAVQVGTHLALTTAALLTGLGLVLWRGPALKERARLATPAVAGLLALVALFLPAMLAQPQPPAESRLAGAWQPFDQGRIAELVAAGEVVFVDVTADWCITCQVNKKLVLDSDEVAARLMAPGVTLMRGDWTLPDDRISAYLSSFGRYGIPFDAVYGPAAPEGMTLPELLSTDAVLEAITAAGG